MPRASRARSVRLWVLLVCGAAFAQGKVGPVFQVNTYTPGDQKNAVVAMRADGGFVVVWDSGPHPLDGSGRAIIGQRFDALGSKVGGEFRVNSTVSGDQMYPSIAMNDSGAFVVVWDRVAQGDCAVQRFDASGSPVGSEISSCSTGNLADRFGPPSIVMDASEGWKVAYRRRVMGIDASFVRRFDASGAPIGGETVVSGPTSYFPVNNRRFPRIGANESRGDFVVSWSHTLDPGYFESRARRFTNDGAPYGGEFQVNGVGYQDADDLYNYADTGMDRHGNFLVVWNTNSRFAFPDCEPSNCWGVVAQRFDPQLGRLGPMFALSDQDGYQDRYRSRVSLDEEGNGVAVWRSYSTAFEGRVFDQANHLVGSSFSVTRAQPAGNPDLAVDATGSFVVVWPESAADGAGTGVMAQRFCMHGSTDGLRLTKSPAGGSLVATWGNVPAADDYVLYEDAAVSGQFATVTGTATNGTSGITTPMPPSNRYYLLSVRSNLCGEGTKR
jgi:hypothetical protein